MQRIGTQLVYSATDVVGALECRHREIPHDATLPRAEQLMRGREATIAAMREGADVIYQAVLLEGRRLGYADFLRRVEQPSELGPWRYEVWDTKLARHAKASAVLQLCMYSEILEAVQGQAPEGMHLALGGVMRERTSFRIADYAGSTAPDGRRWRTSAHRRRSRCVASVRAA